jgi:glycosyltransferase involved in cell wall biosynthesis
MKFIIVHDSLNYCGGAEKLSLETIRSLRNLGHQVSLRTVERTDWRKIEYIFGYVPELYDETYLAEQLSFPRTYRSLLSILAKKKTDPDSVIFNTNGDVIPRIFDDYTYVHIPSPCSLVFRDEEMDNTGLFWDVYFSPNRLIRRALDRLEQRSILLTNSMFSKSKIRDYWKCEAEVLYPPVDVEEYQRLVEEHHDREDFVVTISRFDAVKNLGIIPWIASRSLAAKKFFILGSVKQEEMDVVSELRSKAKAMGTEEKIQFIPNASKEQKREILARAKVLLHPKKHEHFGISIVEGMAAGCIPVVFNGGGPTEYVPSPYRANCLEDFPYLLDNAMLNWNIQTAEEISKNCSRFSSRNYQKRLQEILAKQF